MSLNSKQQNITTLEDVHKAIAKLRRDRDEAFNVPAKQLYVLREEDLEKCLSIVNNKHS